MNEETNLKEFDKVLSDIAKIKDKGNFLPDCSTKAGYEASKTFVLKVTTPARSALVSSHKKVKQYWLDGGRNVDSKKKEIESMIKEVEAPHREAYKAIDDEKKSKEKERIDNIQKGYDFLNGLSLSAVNQSSTAIKELIEECGSFDADPAVYDNQIDNICKLQAKTMERLEEGYKGALRFEEMVKRDNEIKESNPKSSKGIDIKDSNTDHKRKVNNEALESLLSYGIDEDIAKHVLRLIVSNRVTNVQINY